MCNNINTSFSKRNRKIILFIVSLISISLCLLTYPNILLAIEAPFQNPPTSLQEIDLVGTWEVNYRDRGVDSLILRSDGTFKQIYKDFIWENYVYETPWNNWRLESQSNSRLYIHLSEARYYNQGPGFLEKYMEESPPCSEDQSTCQLLNSLSFPFYDPVGQETVYMDDGLVLNVRVDSTGEILLLHMWTSSDRGFVIFGGESEIFRRVGEE